jgi:hypothetical protein
VGLESGWNLEDRLAVETETDVIWPAEAGVGGVGAADEDLIAVGEAGQPG